MSRPRIFVRVSSALSISALSIVAALGCAREIGAHGEQPARPVPVASPVTVTTPPSAIGGGPSAPASTEDAMSQAIRLRCAREQRCDNVGFKRPYSSMDDCVASVAVMHPDDFAGLQCENGVRADALSECLQEISREQCVPGARFASCRSIGLCNSI